MAAIVADTAAAAAAPDAKQTKRKKKVKKEKKKTFKELERESLDPEKKRWTIVRRACSLAGCI